MPLEHLAIHLIGVEHERGFLSRGATLGHLDGRTQHGAHGLWPTHRQRARLGPLADARGEVGAHARKHCDWQRCENVRFESTHEPVQPFW